MFIKYFAPLLTMSIMPDNLPGGYNISVQCVRHFVLRLAATLANAVFLPLMPFPAPRQGTQASGDKDG